MRGKRSGKSPVALENKFTALSAMQRHFEQGQSWAEVAKACGYETPNAAQETVRRLLRAARAWQEEERERRGDEWGDEWWAESLPVLSLRLAPGQDDAGQMVAQTIEMLNRTDGYLAEIERARRSEQVTVAARYLRADLREDIPLMVRVADMIDERG